MLVTCVLSMKILKKKRTEEKAEVQWLVCVWMMNDEDEWKGKEGEKERAR